jgi:hypothetical protein
VGTCSVMRSLLLRHQQATVLWYKHIHSAVMIKEGGKAATFVRRRLPLQLTTTALKKQAWYDFQIVWYCLLGTLAWMPPFNLVARPLSPVLSLFACAAAVFWSCSTCHLFYNINIFCCLTCCNPAAAQSAHWSMMHECMTALPD